MAIDVTEALYRLIVAVRDHEITGNPYFNDTYELASRALLQAIGREEPDSSAWMDAPAIYNRVTGAELNSLRDWQYHHELFFKNARVHEEYAVYKGLLIVVQDRRREPDRVSDYRISIYQHRGDGVSAKQLHHFWAKTHRAGLSYAREQIDQYLLEDELYLQGEDDD